MKTIRTTIKVKDETIKGTIREEVRKYGCEADLNHIDTSEVTSMWDMFHYSQFNGDISLWNVSNVKDMLFMFAQSKFNGDISLWNVSKVVDMNCMFFNSPFNGDISNWILNPKNKDEDILKRIKHSDRKSVV